MSKNCAACGHKPSDHEDGIMGAAINGKSYCHTDDHSCYEPAQWGETAQSVMAPFVDVMNKRVGR